MAQNYDIRPILRPAVGSGSSVNATPSLHAIAACPARTIVFS